MGINQQTLKILLHEHLHIPIRGKYLSIGKQTVNITEEDLIPLLKEYLPSKNVKNIFDNLPPDLYTRQASRMPMRLFNDHDLISIITDNATYQCLDRSNYEGADIICDMNVPLPLYLQEQFDFIYNGSVMDNIFDPVTFIDSTSQMLKPGGRILHIECAAGTPGAYLMYSPEWFFSYYAINSFDDCKVYVTIAKEEGIQTNFFKTDLYLWQPYYTRNPDYKIIDACKSIAGLMHVIVIAQKGKNSTHEKRPIQMQYLDDETEDWRIKYHEFQQNTRPIFMPEYRKKTNTLPYLSDHFIYLGSSF